MNPLILILAQTPAISPPTQNTSLTYIIITVITSFLAAFTGAYIGQKGKNLATKEDIGNITDEIEKVRSNYTERIESIKGIYLLSSAVQEKRMEALQDAYIHWVDLFHSVHQPNVNEVCAKCYKWWKENNLYLPSKIRESFINTIHDTVHHQLLKDDNASADALRENHKKIEGFSDLIMEEAKLSPVSSDIIEKLEKLKL